MIFAVDKTAGYRCRIADRADTPDSFRIPRPASEGFAPCKN